MEQKQNPESMQSSDSTQKKEKKTRGAIKAFSYGSTKRARLMLRNLPNMMTHEIGVTYPRKFPKDGRRVKSHLHKLMLRFRYRGINIFWFMEFQERGACHFHALIDQDIEEDELKRIWYEIVDSGDSRHRHHGAHISAIRSPKGIKKYLASYLTKLEQKTVPSFYADAGRFWGHSRGLINIVTKIIIGTPAELKVIRRNFRLFRRWQKARYRTWNKGAKYPKRMRRINPYADYLPGEYITITDARDLINKLKGTPLDSSLYEGWDDASGL